MKTALLLSVLTIRTPTQTNPEEEEPSECVAQCPDKLCLNVSMYVYTI